MTPAQLEKQRRAGLIACFRKANPEAGRYTKYPGACACKCRCDAVLFPPKTFAEAKARGLPTVAKFPEQFTQRPVERIGVTRSIYGDMRRP